MKILPAEDLRTAQRENFYNTVANALERAKSISADYCQVTIPQGVGSTSELEKCLEAAGYKTNRIEHFDSGVKALEISWRKDND